MSRTLIVELATEERQLPSGRVFDVYVYTLRRKIAPDSAAIMTVRTAFLSAQFDAVADGEYTVSVVALDTDGAQFLASISGDVNVGSAAVPTMYQAPTGLSFLVV